MAQESALVDIDARNRILLSALDVELAATYRLTVLDGGQILLDPQVTMSRWEAELLQTNPAAHAHLLEGLAAADSGDFHNPETS